MLEVGVSLLTGDVIMQLRIGTLLVALLAALTVAPAFAHAGFAWGS